MSFHKRVECGFYLFQSMLLVLGRTSLFFLLLSVLSISMTLCSLVDLNHLGPNREINPEPIYPHTLQQYSRAKQPHGHLSLSTQLHMYMYGLVSLTPHAYVNDCWSLASSVLLRLGHLIGKNIPLIIIRIWMTFYAYDIWTPKLFFIVFRPILMSVHTYNENRKWIQHGSTTSRKIGSVGTLP